MNIIPPTEIENSKESDKPKEIFRLMCYLQGSYVAMYRGPWKALKNDNIIGNYRYPSMNTLEYEILCKYRCQTEDRAKVS